MEKIDLNKYQKCIDERVRLQGKTRTYPSKAIQEYWGINNRRLVEFRETLDRIVESHPGMAKEIESALLELTLFNIPIVRHENGTDFVLTTDTGRVVASGKFIEPLKDVTMEQMDYHLSEEADEDEVNKALAKIDMLEEV